MPLPHLRPLAAVLLTLFLGAAGGACASSEPSDTPPTHDASAGGTAGTGGAAAGQSGSTAGGSAGQAPDASLPDGSTDAPADVSFDYDAPNQDAPLTPDSACASVSAEAHKLPLDIIFLVDNSDSMAQEIHGVEQNINEHFAQIIDASGIDYRVIMISRHGAWTDKHICVKAPLSGTDCDPVPSIPVNNPPRFFHYSHEVKSHDSWRVLLETFDGTAPDEFGLAPQGWSQWLRPQAIKAFAELTDDGVTCSFHGDTFDDNDNATDGATSATLFDKALLARSTIQFGTANRRKYIWYSIVCMSSNAPANAPWLPTDPIQIGKCSSTNCAGPGTGYQALSVLTGGLRFPLCNTSSYDAVFQGIAQNVVGSLACQFAMPPLQTDAGTVDPSKVSLRFTPKQGATEQWPNVPTEASCTGKQWYYDDNNDPKTLLLCPSACAMAKTEQGAKIEILLGCLGN